MRKIIKSLILLDESSEIDPLFDKAIEQFGLGNIRLYGSEILTWLRSDLFIPRKKAIRYPNRPEWFTEFSLFIQNMEELNELFYCEKYSVDFREEIPFDERIEIHQYVAENTKPPHMFVTYR